eukprot:CAMPEP_0181446826 /NCGR_PEP_ID=MMETSP1110-20121109/26309_1 /TAXON_ID=174948 /ORGANISM="Symbiodinium sp., Strain CCMP421" /LENGTH=107 /DNA_ID=CAMNT_0023570925 /DNA_START=23 /DNA_END=346 /DNA_ORIENTATION=-
MGCSTSAGTVQDSHTGHVLSNLGHDTADVFVRDDGMVRRESSVTYVESERSFDSMDRTMPSLGRSPPTARSHQRHVAKLDNFLRRVKADEAELKEEVKIRRLELCVR